MYGVLVCLPSCSVLPESVQAMMNGNAAGRAVDHSGEGELELILQLERVFDELPQRRDSLKDQ